MLVLALLVQALAPISPSPHCPPARLFPPLFPRHPNAIQMKSSRKDTVAKASRDGSPMGLAIVLSGLAFTVLNPDAEVDPLPIACTATVCSRWLAWMERLLRYQMEVQAKRTRGPDL